MKVLKFLKSVGIDLLKTIGEFILMIAILGLFSKLVIIVTDFIPIESRDTIADIVMVVILIGILLWVSIFAICQLVKYLKKKWNE